MKQHTTTEQTAKLIELGFEKPKSYHDIEWDGTEAYDYQLDYSIGELMEMLDNIPDNHWSFSRTSDRIVKVEINVFPQTKRDKHLYRITYRKNLIDALYDMILNLKEEGAI
jgi:hypothetical protein